MHPGKLTYILKMVDLQCRLFADFLPESRRRLSILSDHCQFLCTLCIAGGFMEHLDSMQFDKHKGTNYGHLL